MKLQVFNDILNSGVIITAPQIHFFYEQHHYFRGSSHQIQDAVNVAAKLGVVVLYDGGIPYVESQEDFDKVAQYLIENEVVGHENYCKN